MNLIRTGLIFGFVIWALATAVFVPFVAGIFVGWGLRSLVLIKERERAWHSRQTET